jgi:hypothetical protein
MSNHYRGPSKDASYQISIHLAKRFQRRFLYESTNQKQELPMAAMLINALGQISSLYTGSSIDASYQVSVHLANQFQRFLEIDNSEIRIACGNHDC